MLTIVIPMAGAGSHFEKAGYKDPKPLIPVAGIPMIQRVIQNLTPQMVHRFVFVCQRAHIASYQLDQRLPVWASGCHVISVDDLTEGAACTVLTATALIDNDFPLVIANSDQLIDMDINQFLHFMFASSWDGVIMTMKATHPKWSYVGFDAHQQVNRVVEKEVISDEATVGIYGFKKGRDFVSAAQNMIRKNLRVNNEFYVAPTYNQLLEESKRIGIFNIGHEAKNMHSLGYPEDLAFFLSRTTQQKAEAAL